MKRNNVDADESVDYRKYNQQLKEAIDYETIGYHIKEVRRSKRLTQAAVAEMMHWNTKYYASVESGKRKISLHKLIQFICITKVSADCLLAGCHDDYPPLSMYAVSGSERRLHVNRMLDKCSESEMKLIETVLEGLLAKR